MYMYISTVSKPNLTATVYSVQYLQVEDIGGVPKYLPPPGGVTWVRVTTMHVLIREGIVMNA